MKRSILFLTYFMKQTTKMFLWFIFCIVVIAAFSTLAFAQAKTGTPDVFKVTLKKIEISLDGTNFVTIKEADQVIDIASVTAGQSAASYASGSAIPSGTATKMRVTVDKTLTMRGVIYNNNSGEDRTSWTTSGSSANNGVSGGDDSGSPGSLAGYAETTFDIPAGSLTNGLFIVTVTLTSPITVNPGDSPPTMRINFDVSDTIQEPGNGTIQLNQAPTVTISQQ